MWFFLFLIFSETPQLEIPHVTIYGEIEKIKISKASLLPDSVYPLPEIHQYLPKPIKLRLKERVQRKDYATRVLFEIGSSGMASIYSGIGKFYLNAVYEKGVIGLDENMKFDIGIPHIRAYYQNISFKGGENLRKSEYSQTGVRLNYLRDPFSLIGGYERNKLAGDKLDKIILNAGLRLSNLNIYNQTKIYLDNYYISSLSIDLPIKLGDLTLSPGIFGSLGDNRDLCKVYPIFHIKYLLGDLLIYSSFSPYTTIMERRVILNENPFSTNAPYHYDTGTSVKFSIVSPHWRLSAGYKENFPIFLYDTTSYEVTDTQAFFVEGRTEWGTLALNVRYQSNTSEYMPYLYLSPELGFIFGLFEFGLSSPIMLREEPSGILLIPNISLKYSLLKNLSLISSLVIPTGERALWEGCYEETTKMYFGISVSL